MANLRFGVVGCGRIGKLHINNLLNNIEGAEVVAAADPMLDKSGARELRRPSVPRQNRCTGA